MNQYEKVQKICKRLNKDAYAQQKTGTQFTPCEKSMYLIGAQRAGVHLAVMLEEVQTVPCHCHTAISYNNILDIIYEGEK